MSLRKKIVIAFFGLLCCVFVALLILAKIIITPERVRESLVPIVMDSLNRNLELGEIEISLFSGIVINDLVLTERDSDESFLTVDKTVLRYRLWPLMLLRVEIDELRLERPLLHIIKLQEERFNFSDMAADAPESNAGEMPGQTTSSDSQPVGVHVSEIVIVDGTLLYTDQTPDGETPQRFSGLNLSAKDFSLTEPFSALLSTDWNGNEVVIDGEVDLDDLSVDVVARLNLIQLEVKGDLLADAKGDRLRADIRLPSMLVRDFIVSVPKEFIDLTDQSGLSGQFSAEMSLDGLLADPDKLLNTGKIDLDGIVAATQFTRTVLDGSILIEKKAFRTENLSMKINDQSVDVLVKADNFIRQPLKADFSIRSSRVDLDRFIPADVESGKNKAKSESTDQSSDKINEQLSEIGPFDLPVELSGDIKVTQLLYHGLEMQNFSTQLTLIDSKLTIEKLVMDVAGGSVEQTGKVDLGVQGIRYSNRSTLKDIQINPVVQALKPEFSKNIYGVVDGQLQMRGAGTIESSIKKNLVGKGSLFLNQAKLTRMPTLDSVAKLLAMPDLKEIVIDEGQADFQLSKGLLTLDLNSKGPHVKQITSGTVSLGGHLDLKANILMSPALSQKLDKKGLLRNILVGRDGWSQVPLRVKGDSSDPKVALDMKVIKKQAAQGALDSLANRLLNKSKKDNGGSEAKQNDDPASKLIDGALKGLFGN